MNRPFISIVIPLYNKALYIGNTLKSVLNQTYVNYEILIIDDGSIDDGVEIIKKNYQNDKIRIIQKENGGPSSARNRGVQEAKGDWIVFLDADDMLLPYALDYFAYLINDNDGIDYFVCNYFLGVDGKAKLFTNSRHFGIINNPFYLEAIRELSERPGSAAIKKELLLNHPFKDELRRYEDAECQYELMRGRSVFQSYIPVMISDRDAGDASNLRSNCKEDFICNLNFNNKSYWEQIALYLLALECKLCYPSYANKNYSKVFRRLDLKIGYLIVCIRSKVNNLIMNCRSSKEYDYSSLLELENYDSFR